MRPLNVFELIFIWWIQKLRLIPTGKNDGHRGCLTMAESVEFTTIYSNKFDLSNRYITKNGRLIMQRPFNSYLSGDKVISKQETWTDKNNEPKSQTLQNLSSEGKYQTNVKILFLNSSSGYNQTIWDYRINSWNSTTEVYSSQATWLNSLVVVKV